MSTKEERWKVVKAYPSYAVSSHGRILNMKFDRFVEPIPTKSGHTQVTFCEKPKRDRTIYLHRLVAMYFLDDYTSGFKINHKDGDITNNTASNLEMTDHGVRRGSEWALSSLPIS